MEPAEKNTHGTDYYQIVTTSQEAFASQNDENQRCQIENTLQNHTAHRIDRTADPAAQSNHNSKEKNYNSQINPFKIHLKHLITFHVVVFSS